MIEVKKEGVLLTKTDLEFENEGVLNPAIMREGDSVHMLYRAVRKGNHSSIDDLVRNHVSLHTKRWTRVYSTGYKSQPAV